MSDRARTGFFVGSRIRAQRQAARTIPQCGTCGLYKHCHSPRMPVTGGGARRILFVAEAPGAREDEEGTQLIGKAGQYLLHILGFDLDTDGWKTNALICRPPHNRTPTGREIGYCMPNLHNAIRELDPIVVVPLGAAAVQAVLGRTWTKDMGKISRWTKWNIPCQETNMWVCPTWHPSYILREDDAVLSGQFRDQLATAIEHESKPWPTGAPNWASEVRRILDPEEAARWVRAVATRENGAVAWDYEANMLKPEWSDAQIVSCAVAWGRKEPECCAAFPWHGPAIRAVGELLRSPIPKIAGNLKFEDRWTRAVFGHRVRRWVWDTVLAAHVCDNREQTTSVKFQAFVRLGVAPWDDHIEPFLHTKGNERVNAILREIDIEDLLVYNGLDALLEFRVACDQIAELGCPQPWSV